MRNQSYKFGIGIFKKGLEFLKVIQSQSVAWNKLTMEILWLLEVKIREL